MPSTPQPAFEPRSTIILAVIAVSVPSFRAPTLRWETCAEAGLVAWKSSVLREDDTHRATQRERRTRRQRLHQGELAAEGAAQRLRDHADPLQRQAECAGELSLRHERALGAGRDDEVSVRLQPRRCDLGLDVRLVDPGRPERPRDDDVARLENRRCVAGAAMNGVEDVARELLVVTVLLALVHARVNRLEVASVFGLHG